MKPSYINDLDEYFAATYSDYVRIAAIEGYQMPDLIVIGADGNVGRKNEALLRISYQKDKVLVLENFKRDLDDTFFQFSFSFRSIRDKFGDIRRKFTFAKILPSVLERSGETVESAGEKLSIKSEYWNKIV